MYERRPRWMTEDCLDLYEVAKSFFEKEAAPNATRWADQRRVDRDFWRAAGRVWVCQPDLAPA